MSFWLTDIIFPFLGGVALFLLGMKLLTDGLRFAAGNTLRTLLYKYTSTPIKGVLSGILITALVQSSSAVIFATIGFINAGLISLLQAVYVIFGSNVGTTLTGWIIASVGFKVNLQLLAMPILSVGIALWLTKKDTTVGALGQALVGFGIFFLGIDVLKTTFEDAGEFVPFERIGGGISGMSILFIIGLALTMVMQSSSASIAVIITAVGGGIIPVEAGAVMVVGADIGTTSTALLAVIGATSNAKRAAMAHVLFNVLKGPIALPFIGFYIAAIYGVFGDDLSLPFVIAIFHTSIKIIGLLVLLPFTAMLVRFLEKRFLDEHALPENLRYLDQTVINTPALAISALIFELKRVDRKASKFVRGVVRSELKGAELEKRSKNIQILSNSVIEYLQKIKTSGLPEDLEQVVPDALRVIQYLSDARINAVESEKNKTKGVLPADIEKSLITLRKMLVSFARISDSESTEFSVDELSKLQTQLEELYQTLKKLILSETSRGELKLETMLEVHEQIRNYRRIWDQLYKAAVYLDGFNKLIEREPGIGEPLQETAEYHHNEPNTNVAIPK